MQLEELFESANIICKFSLKILQLRFNLNGLTVNKKFLDLDDSFPNSYRQKTLKVVRNSTTCNLGITDPMTIDI